MDRRFGSNGKILGVTWRFEAGDEIARNSLRATVSSVIRF
jgi:hypothetical protein